MSNNNYRCSQSALYQIGRNIYASLLQYLPSFTNFKPKYDAAFITAGNLAIVTAENTPEFQARSAQAEVNYNLLCTSLTTTTTLWQSLKRYILATFPTIDHKARIEEAGALFYEQASAKDWDAARSLLIGANNFITLHSATLLTGQNMPPAFQATFQTETDTFIDALTTFQQSEETVKVSTAEKINMNNQIYAAIIEICLDGQIIYKNTPEIKDQFTFTSVLELVSGIGTTGFKGYIMDNINNIPVPNATITTNPPTKTKTTDPDGYYEIIQIPTGQYTVLVNAPNYQPFAIANYQVDTGITHNLSIPLQPNP